MADKVDQIMEYTLDELNFYKKEELFSKRECQQIVKNRRSFEYEMFRKDAQVTFFIDAINFEKQLWTKKNLRKKQQRKKKGQQKSNFNFQDQAIKRRIIHLYERASRKFKHNMALWKEYLHFLMRSKSTQKLNRVISNLL